MGRADAGGDGGCAVEDLRLRDGPAEEDPGYLRCRQPAGRERVDGDVDGEIDARELSQRTLPAGKWRGPAEADGNTGVTEDHWLTPVGGRDLARCGRPAARAHAATGSCRWCGAAHRGPGG